MRDNKTGGLCPATRPQSGLTGFVIAGAVAFCVGLAGTVGAVQFSTQADVNAATRAESLGRDLSNLQAGSPNAGSLHSFASPTPYSLSSSALAASVGRSRSPDSWQFNLRRRMYGLSTPSPTVRTPGVAPAGIPDGGSSALMLGGVLCGLALLVRKPRT